MNTINNTINISKIQGFDYLRAICCVMVVAIHCNVSVIFSGHEDIQNAISYHIWDLAVPIFMQTALVLFFINRQKYPNYFWNKRFFKMIKLYLFWGTVSHIYHLIFKNAIYNDFLNQSITWNTLIDFIILDGYDNPFYFFSYLLFVTTLAELVLMLIDKTQIQAKFIIYPGLFISFIMVSFLPLILVMLKILGIQLDHADQAVNILSFTPYIFSSFLISQSLTQQKQENNTDQINYLQIFILLFMIVIFIFMESRFLIQPFISHNTDYFYLPPFRPAFSRLSLVFSAWFITLISLKISSIPQPVIKLISDLSLGIYGLHTFIYTTLQDLCIRIDIFAVFTNTANISILLFFMTLILATSSAKLLKNFRIFQDVV